MEETILFAYMFSLTVLFIFGSHGFIMIYYYLKFRKKNHPAAEDIVTYPVATVQLPVYNEMYVVERLIDAACAMVYPKDKLEIQVLDDSNDQTVDVVRSLVERYRKQGFDIKHVRRTNRTGFKAGALKEGLVTARGEFVAIFDADFVPRPDFLLKTLMIKGITRIITGAGSLTRKQRKWAQHIPATNRSTPNRAGILTWKLTTKIGT